jgi:hypothetical protein
MSPTPVCLTVSLPEQVLSVFLDGALERTLPVSTSAAPASCTDGSGGTPWGLHEIADKFGDGEPRGTVFRGRVSTGQRFWELPGEEQEGNLITTRILWLRGVEPGLNSGVGVDSYHRYVYLHGTNHETRIGTPSSGGCVQLLNRDVEQLFDLVPLGSLVFLDRGSPDPTS